MWVKRIKFTLNSFVNYFPLVIIAAVLIVYLQTFFFKLIFLDDYYIVYERNANVAFFSKLGEAFSTNYLGNHYYRPLTVVSFIINSVLSGTHPQVYHITNVFLHAITSVMVFLLMRKLNYAGVVSLFAALMFAVTPIQVNAVGWIAGRADLLAGLFSACALLSFSKNGNTSKVVTTTLMSLSVCAAIFSKEVALVIPFLLVIYSAIRPHNFSAVKSKLAFVSLSSLIILFYIFIRAEVLTDVRIDKFSMTTFIYNLPVIPETVFKFFIPLGVRTLPDYDTILSIAGSILILLLIALPFFMRSIDKRKYFFGLCWFVALMLPGMFFRTMNTNGFFYWDCRSYTALIGLVIIAAEISNSWSKNLSQKHIPLPAVLYLAAFVIASVFLVRKYETAVTYWSSVEKDYPLRYLPHIQLFSYYSFIGDKAKSEIEIKKAVSLCPTSMVNRTTLINFFLKEEKPDDAYREILVGLKLNNDPDDLSLIPPLVIACGKLEKSKQLDSVISAAANNRRRLNKLNEIIISCKQGFDKENNLAASSFLAIRIQKIEFLLKLLSSVPL
jgi:protein O-mannosyl-transferase